MATNLTESQRALCDTYFSLNSDVAGTGVFTFVSICKLTAPVCRSGSLYLQFIFCVLIALSVKNKPGDSDFRNLVNNTTKFTFSSSFAISLTILIARIRNVISSANMIIGVDLSLALWTAGMYAITMTLRTLGSTIGGFKPLLKSKLNIAGIIVCSILVFASWIWGEILPDPGAGEIALCNQYETSGVRLLPGGPIVIALKVVFSILAIIVAAVPRRYWKGEDWLKWTSFFIVVFDLAAIIAMIELISNMVFEFKGENLGLGQIMAICLEIAQIWEIGRVVFDGETPVSEYAAETRLVRSMSRLATGSVRRNARF